MQLKGLVQFFTVALIVICIYQLSFTWIVRNHESEMDAKAQSWVNRLYPTPQQKYPDNKDLQSAYADSLKGIKAKRLQQLLDSTRDTKIGLWRTTYASAKEKELTLGLDLQGGMSVTMEVGLDGLIHSLANYTKDEKFTKALNAAIGRKANSNADLITLFNEEFKAATNNGALAPYFSMKSAGKIKFNDNNDVVIAYLREQAAAAFNNTYRILRTRIDRFGVASPSINPDPIKGIINIELAGANDPERIRHYLQSTANLQFFEVYNVSQIGEPVLAAEKALADYLKGGNTATADSLTATASDSTAKPASDSLKAEDAPLRSLIFFAQGQQDPNTGAVHFPSYLGYVQLKDTSLVNSYLRMDVVKNKFPSNLVFMYGKNDNTDPAAKNILPLYAVKTLENGTAELEGEHVSQASQDYDERGRIAIKMTMDPTGTRIWAKMTQRAAPNAQNGNVPQPIAIVLDNFVYSAPFVNDAITTGSSQITGSFSIKEAQDLAEILQSGKLPAPAKIVQESIVGPTLGQQAIQGGSMSFLISFVVIFALMLIYYNTAGWVANIALILNLLFTIGILSAMGFTLTAPGIAGLVLTIGMAVDTNVIIFERIKEELARGKSYSVAVADGYKRSYAPVLDAHITTLLTAIILAYFGLGPVLGFATTQIIGLLLSLFCGILVSRMITDLYTNKNRHFNYFTKISDKVFKHAQIKFVEYRKYAYMFSVVVLIFGIGSFFHGFDEGVEFAGGRSYTVTFPTAPNVEDVRAELAKKEYFGESPIIKTIGTSSQLNITTAYKIKESGNNIDSMVERTLYSGLAKFYPAGTSYENFRSTYRQSSQTVLPSISDDLKAGATKATFFALLVICLYIFIRFRDWRFSIGTIFSLMHDILITLAIFSFAKDFVPFPLEIGQHFIAAILTVIGFSMNDTVIVYDRIREDSRLMKNAPKATIINTAINQTLSRTIMTSLTVFLTILILFIFGGEVTRGFAFAMLIGIVAGTYSSIFVAAPILLDFAKDKPLGNSAVDAEPKKEKPVVNA